MAGGLGLVSLSLHLCLAVSCTQAAALLQPGYKTELALGVMGSQQWDLLDLESLQPSCTPS